MTSWRAWALSLIFLSSTCSALSATTSSSGSKAVAVNYVYATQLGIGGYSLGGLSVNVFTAPLAHTFRLGKDGSWKLKVRLPINLGIYTFNATEANGTKVSTDQQTLSLIPGLQLDIPVADNWALKPFGDFGFGHSLNSGGSYAYIYSLGVKSVAEWHRQRYTFALGNRVIYAGDAVFGPGQREAYLALETGVEVRHPLGFNIGELESDLGLYAVHYFYPNEIEFPRFLQGPLRVQNQGELGFSIGSAAPFDLWEISNPRLGASYISGGGLTVYRVNFGFPF